MDTIKKTISLKPYTGSTERDYYQPKPVSDEVRTVAEKYAWDFDGLVEGRQSPKRTSPLQCEPHRSPA